MAWRSSPDSPERFALPAGLEIDDVAPDGRRLVARQGAEGDQVAREVDYVHAIFNWDTELAAATQ